MDAFSFVSSYVQSLATVRGATIAVGSFVGLSLIIAASFARTMVRLRTFTVLSNVCLLTTAVAAPNPVSIILFLILLPLNGWRLIEILQLTKKA